MSNNFVDITAENGDLNQYWYSPATIAKIVGKLYTLYTLYYIVTC